MNAAAAASQPRNRPLDAGGRVQIESGPFDVGVTVTGRGAIDLGPVAGGAAGTICRPGKHRGMDIKQIKTLTDLMVNNDLTEIMIRDGDTRIVLRRGGVSGTPQVVAPAPIVVSTAPAASSAAAESSAPAVDDTLATITSPMVGTFYAAADPETPPYVNVGGTVNTESVVCIIEAMKVFNEIKAEVTGRIESVEVKNGEPVEFGQVLFRVRTG